MVYINDTHPIDVLDVGLDERVPNEMLGTTDVVRTTHDYTELQHQEQEGVHSILQVVGARFAMQSVPSQLRARHSHTQGSKNHERNLLESRVPRVLVVQVS